MIDDGALRFADLEVLVDGDVRMTFREYGAAIETSDPEEIILWCRTEMANYKVAREVTSSTNFH